MIGRRSELERIHALGAREGSAAVVVVGDSGSGKSRLLAEAAAESSQRVFRIVGYEPERLVPLAAASELLRAVAADETFGPAAAPQIEPVRVFEATHRALQELERVLLVADDVQWVDDLSLALLHYVVRAAALGGGDLHLLAAGRPTARTHGLSEDLKNLLAPEAFATIELGGLPREDGLRLARAVDASLSESDAGDLWERSGGLPFWIEALARARGEPLEAGRLLTSRLRDAGADAASLLGLLAVVARPIADDAAASLLGWQPERLEHAADELSARGIAVRSRGSLALSHDLLRAAAFDELPERRRRVLHVAVAEWLERTAADELALLCEALEHRAAAGELPLGLAARLVASPQRRRLGHEGLSTVAAIAATADGGTAEAQALRAGIAALASELGDHRLALEHWTALLPFVTDAEERFEALLGASKAALELGWEEGGRAHELLDEALACAPSEEALVSARAHQARVLLWLDHRTAEGAAIAREALERSRSFGPGTRQHRVRLQALRTAREASMQEADGEGMLRLAEETLALIDERDEDALVEALFARAVGENRTQPLAVADATLRQTWELATRRVLPAEAAEAGLARAALLHDRGRLEEAARCLAAAEELAVRLEGVMPARLIGNELALIRGNVDGAVEDYLAAIELRRDPHMRIIPSQVFAQFLARARGEAARDQVVSVLCGAREDAVAAACPRCGNELHLFAAEALARAGCQGEAEAELAQGEAVQARDPYLSFVWLRARAVVTASRDPAAGASLIEQVCAEAERLDRQVDLLWAQVELARVLAGTDRARAANLLREVASASAGIGAVAITHVAERELRRLGVRTWRRGRSRVEDGSLSDRERQVAELVATGASNPEIAQALFLSRKTVERHVSNVLAKAGVRNRAELAALLAREGEGAPR